MFLPEVEHGNIEYKKCLNKKHLEYNRKEELISQMLWRVAEGKGTALYYLGIEDDGNIANITPDILKESIKVLTHIVDHIPIIAITKITKYDHYCIIELRKENIIKKELRVIVMGPQGSGKTTLISCLMYQEADNGKGMARNKIITHKDELFHGSTLDMTIHMTMLTNNRITEDLSKHSFDKMYNEGDTVLFLIDTPNDINKVSKIAEYTYPDIAFILHEPGSDITRYIDIADKHNIPYRIYTTKKDIYPKSVLCFNSQLIQPEFDDIKLRTISLDNCRGRVIKTIFRDTMGAILMCIHVNGSIHVNDLVRIKTKDRIVNVHIVSIHHIGKSVDTLAHKTIYTMYVKYDNMTSIPKTISGGWIL